MASEIPKTQTALQIQKNGGPEVLEVVENVRVPELGPTDVLIKVEYAG